MKFTPTDNFSLLANAASKVVSFNVYMKKTSTLGESLTAGTWIDVSQYVILDSLGNAEASIEYDIGKFTSGTLQLQGSDINYWSTNILNDISTQHLECKVLMYLSMGSLSTTDTAYFFTGFVDPTTIEYNDEDDTVQLSVYTVDNIGSTIPAETTAVQYQSNGSLYLRNIPSMYLVNASACYYGLHSIVYNNTSASGHTVRFDGGTPRVIGVAGSYGLTASDGVQEIRISVSNPNTLPSSIKDVDIQEDFVVNVEGDALPKQWFQNRSAIQCLKTLYDAIGLTSVDSSGVSFTTTGNGIYFVDQIGNNTTTGGIYASALTSISGNLYIGSGRNLYKRDNNGDYTLLATLTGEANNIVKFDYVSYRSHLWIYAQASLDTAAEPYIYRYTLSSGDLSAEVSGDQFRRYHTCVYDTEDNGVAYNIYGLLYIEPSFQAVKLLDGYDLTTSYAVVPPTIATPYSGIGYRRTNRFGFLAYDGSTPVLEEIYYDTTQGEWEVEVVNTHFYGTNPCEYHPTEDRFYFNDIGTTHTLRYQDRTNPVAFELVPIGDSSSLVYSPTDDTIYTTTTEGLLYAVSGGTYTVLNANSQKVNSIYYGMTYHTDRLYGVDGYNRLFTYCNQFYPFTEYAAFNGQSITDAIHKLLKAFNLVSIVSANKTVYIYRRVENDGSLLSTGNIFTVGENKVGRVTQQLLYVSPIDFIEVSNSKSKASYNGSAFGTRTLTANMVSISNDLIPTHLLNDVAYHTWQYYKDGRTKYTIGVDGIPFYNYEPLDAVQISYDSNIDVSLAGVIYRAFYGSNLDFTLEVVV